ncbi:hypothetical protein WISP_122502 [Willisornis vidua]|uniref:Secreted protein n=1 Tax=Willisornis vidua TaxID=1566151 RepID=A0ABQ9CS63_9PASS|nr:hypothetical protein WISP_122502 [Willisornis vidua]
MMASLFFFLSLTPRWDERAVGRSIHILRICFSWSLQDFVECGPFAKNFEWLWVCPDDKKLLMAAAMCIDKKERGV